jgi:hypothetical protein
MGFMRPGQKFILKRADGTKVAKVYKSPGKSIVKKAVRKARNSAFAKKVLKVVNRGEETKMVAENILTPAVAIPAAQTTPANLARIMPRLGQGTGDFQRIGDQINPLRACTYWTVFPAETTLNLYDITVNLVIVKVKGAGTDLAVAATPGTDFLRVGDGTTVDPNNPNQESMLTLINRYPVNTERYTVLKHFRHRFCKGPNSINGAVGAAGNNNPPTAGPANPTHVFKYSWTPPSLKYDNGAATLPTNHYPVYLIWATANDASAYVGNVKFAVRSEMYFKDA